MNDRMTEAELDIWLASLEWDDPPQTCRCDVCMELREEWTPEPPCVRDDDCG